ncbi:hypothetical protein [Phreatobacter stygius]|uniref:Uncharacterized protein n=1 Tax=Phreatobacter stygius TaxID=1940610 RepID=A0A4D7B8J8_9HYPH|nr:hypothetical protein [Phreatobacter stygius]QCI66760.1 hypothetical protein E8M01_22470 [Phreatobacter stygius]
MSLSRDELGQGDEAAGAAAGPDGPVAGRPYPPLPLTIALVEDLGRFPQVRVVRDQQMLKRIGRLRYGQGVREPEKVTTSVVSDPGCLIEASDFKGVNVLSFDADGVTVALRVGDALDQGSPGFDTHRQVMRAHGIAPFLAYTCSRLVCAPRHGGEDLAALLGYVRWQAVHAGWRYGLLQASQDQVASCRACDFRETGMFIDDPVAGRLQVLVLDSQGRAGRDPAAAAPG